MNMRIVTQDGFGPPSVLRPGTAPVPDPLPTEVRVRVRAAGVNPVDWKTRAGQGMAAVLGEPPFVLGWDVAGVVDAVGRGVTRFAVGDEVYGMPWFPRPAGAYAEYVTAPSRHLAHRPRSVGMTESGALPLAALTAWQILVDTAAVAPGRRVLVHNAGGGVGHLAVQIAKAHDAEVIGTASHGKHALVTRLGADQVLDHHGVAFEEEIHGVDVAIDLVGGDSAFRCLRTVRAGGLLVTVPSVLPDGIHEAAAERDVRVTGVVVEPDHGALERIAVLVDAGRLEVQVETTYPLESAARAHEHGEQGRTTGKMVLLVD